MSVNEKRYVEKIIHRTGKSSFSLHSTIVDEDDTSALYLHCHSEAEIFYLDAGEIEFYVENHIYHLKSGDAIFIPPNMTHHADKCGRLDIKCHYHAVVFSIESLFEKYSNENSIYFSGISRRRLECIFPLYAVDDKNKTLLSILPTIFANTYGQPIDIELSVTGMLLICWQELYNNYFSVLEKHTPFGKDYSEIQTSIDYVLNHYSEPITLSTLASYSGFCEGHYCHVFKNCTGFTPFEYVNRIRIIKSCDLLAQTNKKITDIAILCGFNNVSYYNRTFTKIIGSTPSQYRKNQDIHT